MVELDAQEEMALKEFQQILEIQRVDPKPKVIQSCIHRGSEEQIIFPVTLPATSPSLSLARLMGHRAEHLYKQTACRLVLAQCPAKDSKNSMYIRVKMPGIRFPN